jgi:hypothetical protein
MDGYLGRWHLLHMHPFHAQVYNLSHEDEVTCPVEAGSDLILRQKHNLPPTDSSIIIINCVRYGIPGVLLGLMCM